MRKTFGWRSGRGPRTTSTSVALALALAAALVLAGCSGNGKWRNPGESASKGPIASAKVTTPVDGAIDVSTAIELAYSADHATVSKVALAETDGATVAGAPRPGGETWLPAKQLKYATKYTATVTATTASGETIKGTTTFTTMSKPAGLIQVTTALGDDGVYGVAMPIIITLSDPANGGKPYEVPAAKRAAVQNRFFVTSDPPQEGAWNWFSASEVHFRPKEYWQAGTKLSFRIATGGLALGATTYGRNDLNVHANIGAKLVMTGDNATKSLTVTKDDQVLKTMPVSFGKPSSPSPAGNMMVMVKNDFEWFDSSTYGVPADSKDGYRTKVLWTERITWSGSYLHAAPWSEDDQGKRNVSHGCTNLSLADAEWLYQQTHLGDPVIINGTEERVKWGNGWTDWERPFEEYVKGSAIPYVASSPTGSPAPSSGGSTPSPTPS
jgi:lipoprotein-anchoring transpeptidase ErfK/SrfK